MLSLAESFAELRGSFIAKISTVCADANNMAPIHSIRYVRVAVCVRASLCDGFFLVLSAPQPGSQRDARTIVLFHSYHSGARPLLLRYVSEGERHEQKS